MAARILFALVSGLLAQLAVAVSLAAWSGRHDFRSLSTPKLEESLQYWDDHYPYDTEYVHVFREYEPSEDESPLACVIPLYSDMADVLSSRGLATLHMSGRSADYKQDIDLIRVSTGWPFRSLTGRRWRLSGGPSRVEVLQGLISLPSRSSDTLVFLNGSRYLPYHLMPLRTLGNTLLYGAAIWLVLKLLSMLRRSFRRRRARCVQCAYPCSTSSTCPECGLPTA